jgi:hypothetical protein
VSSLYLSPLELAQSPTGIPWTALVAELGVPTAAALQQYYCSTVSAMIDNYVGKDVYAGSRPYQLHASDDTETALTDEAKQTFIDSHGDLIFLARYRPIINVLSGSLVPSVGSGQTGGQPIPFVMSDVEWEGREIIHYGPFRQFEGPLRVSVTYIDGFGNAVLTADQAIGAASIPLDDLTGFTPGQELTVYDMPPEEVFVASTFVPARGPGNLPLVSGIVGAHKAGIRVSALGDDAKQAAIFLVQHLVQTRGLAQAQAAWNVFGERTVNTGPTDFLGWGLQLLENYRVVAF